MTNQFSCTFSLKFHIFCDVYLKVVLLLCSCLQCSKYSISLLSFYVLVYFLPYQSIFLSYCPFNFYEVTSCDICKAIFLLCAYLVNIFNFLSDCSMIPIQLFTISKIVFLSFNNLTISFFSLEIIFFLQSMEILLYLKLNNKYQNYKCTIWWPNIKFHNTTR